MAREPERRSDPQAVLPGCRSILSVGVNYYTHDTPDHDPSCGRIAQYAWGEDYHRLFKRRLKQLEKAIQILAPDAHTRRYADTGPIMEKAWAQEAGLGMDWKTFKSRLNRIWLLAPARRNINDGRT